MQFVLFCSLNLSVNYILRTEKIYPRCSSNSKETSVTLKGNHGGLGGLKEDLTSTQITTSFPYMPKMAFGFAGTPGDHPAFFVMRLAGY